ncbi:hypothetical protein DD581_33825, partial [Klebsiella pneumoniae]
MSKSLNHIPPFPLNPQSALLALLECLADLALKFQMEEEIHIQLISTLKEIYWKKISLMPQVWLSTDSTWLTPKIKTAIFDSKEKWLIIGVDKASNTASFICKRLAFEAAY